jgi:nitroreductase
MELNETLKTIFGRKSVRNFIEGNIPYGDLELIVKAGMAAPSAVDKRPWEFIIITDKNMLKKLADALPYAKMAEFAQAGIVVCGDINKQHGGKESSYWVQDCAAATENILLAVESLGYGAVWTALFPYQERINPAVELLNLPDNIKPLNFIPIGIPAGIDLPKDKFNPEQIHKERW